MLVQAFIQEGGYPQDYPSTGGGIPKQEPVRD